jgi:Transposase DDE domain group 1
VGETQNQPLQLSFNPCLKVDFQGSRVTSDGGLLLVRLALSLLAYNLGNLWRRLALPQGIEKWSLTSLQQRLVKTGGRLVKHARYYWLFLAEGHLTRRRFGAMVRRIEWLPLPAG